MQTSPYFTGAAPNFGPPSGMAGLISQDRSMQMDTSGFKQFADIGAQYKQLQAQGKAADATVAAYPDLLNAAGMDQEQFKTLGARDKAAVVSGVVQAQAQKSIVQQMADVAAQAKEREAQANAASDTGDFLRSYAGDLPAGVEDTPQNRLANALHSMRPGADVGRVFPQAMNSLQKFAAIGASGNKKVIYSTDPVSGRRVATYGNTMEPSGEDPSIAAPPEAPPGYQTARDGKGGYKYLKLAPSTMTEADKTKFTAQYQKNIDDLLKSYAFAKGDPEMEQLFKDRIAAHQQSIKELNQPAPAKPAATPAGSPPFKSAEEVKAAVSNGSLDKAAAVKILQSQFGMK